MLNMQTPITILTGYLGAGKTTLLNNILNTDHNMRIAVLVNDFGVINIDTKLIVEVEGETISLSNGCICCTIRDDLIESVSGLLDSENPPDYIVIEASGVSDPAQVVLTFNRSAIQSQVRIDSIITVIDAEQFNEIKGKPEQLIREQLRVADIVVLNKIDLVDDDQLENMRNIIQDIVDKPRILETSYANVPPELLIGIDINNRERTMQTPQHNVHVHDVDEVHDHEHDDHTLIFSTWTWRCPDPLSIIALRGVLEEIPIEIYRIKGIVYTQDLPDRQVTLQMVGKRASLTEGGVWGTQTPITTITMIGNPQAFQTEQLKYQLEQCRATTPRDDNPLIDGILRWLRFK